MKPPVRYDYQLPRHRVSPPQPRALHVVTWMLAAVTLIALLSLGSLFVTPQSLVARERPGELIQEFYAGMNAILAGGRPAELERIVAPDLIEHRPGMPSGDRATLLRRLTDLRLAAPGARLNLSASLADGDWAAARVMPLGLDRDVNGASVDPPPEPPTLTEFFRVDAGKIVEYWSGGSVIDVPKALPPITVAPWMTETAVAVARLTFPTGAALHDLDSPGEHLILLESGELDIRLTGSASRFEVGRAEAGWQTTPVSGQELVLQAGDAVLIPPGIRHTISNIGAGAATVLGVAMFPTTALDALDREHEMSGSQLIAIYDPARVDTRTTWDRHVRVEVLTTGVGEARSGPCAAVARTQVNMTRFTLGPGEGLPSHPVEGIELLAITSAVLEIVTPASVDVSAPAAGPTNERVLPKASPWSGQGLDFSSPSAPPIRNPGQDPLNVVALALRPTGGTSCATAPSDT
jgi:predicted SnoaL-like aldol condensation-catalyzing enzyme